MSERLTYQGMRVQVSSMLPYESTDPDRPGVVHALRGDPRAPGLDPAFLEPILFVSAELLEQLKRRAFWDKSRGWFRRAS